MKTFLSVIASLAASLPVLADGSNWWEAYANESLNTLIEQGLAEHPEPLVALRAVDGARSSRQLASSALKPSADVSIGYRVGREKTMYTDREEGDVDPFFGKARISWEIDLFGRAREAVRAADARVEISEAERQGVRLMLSSAIAATYFQAAYLKEKDETDRDLLLDTVSRYRRISARVGAGLQDQPALDRAVSDIQMALHHRMLTNIEQAKVLNELASLVGKRVELDDIPLLDKFKLPRIPDFDTEAQMNGRPDVLAAWWKVESVLADAQSAKKSRAPTFELVASAAANADENETEPWEAWVGPAVKIPLWRPDLKAVSLRAQSHVEATQASFEAVALKAMREIQDTMDQREHSNSMIAHLSLRHQNLEHAEASAKRKYEAGLTREDAYLDARHDQLQSRHGRIVWVRQALIDHLDLIKALGGTISRDRDQETSVEQ